MRSNQTTLILSEPCLNQLMPQFVPEVDEDMQVGAERQTYAAPVVGVRWQAIEQLESWPQASVWSAR